MGIITKVNLDVHGMRLITALSHVNFEKQMYIIWVHFLKYNYEFYIINICKEKEIDVYNTEACNRHIFLQKARKGLFNKYPAASLRIVYYQYSCLS